LNFIQKEAATPAAFFLPFIAKKLLSAHVMFFCQYVQKIKNQVPGFQFVS